SLGSTTIGFTGADHPSIEFLPAPSTAPMLTALLTFASHNVLYRCAALLLPNQPVHLDYAAGSCLRQNSLPVDMGALRFSGVELIAPADRNDLSQLKNAVAGARLVETAWQGSFTPMLPARGTVQTSGRVLRLSSGGNLTSAEIGPPLGLGPAQGALVSGQIGGRAVKGVVSFSGPRALSIEEADHTVDWVPNRSADALAISGYRLPVTLNWRIPGLRDAVVGLRIDGCAADGGGTVSLSGTAGGKPQAYHQSLAAAGDGRGLLATLGTVQAFAGPSARLTGISAICAADVPQGGSQVVDAQLTLLRRPSKAAAPVIVRALQGSAGPAAMHLGRISPMASVAAAGAPPAPAPPPALDCQSPGVHCSMGGVRAPLPADFEGLAVLNRLYDPSWIAVVAGHGLTFPKHVVADGWRNAWFVSQGGELFVLNLMNVLSAAGLLLGFGIIAWQLRYRRS
ncbi:MAG TPA: hypothetical protein VFN37_05525, partial [Candidatus Baltobacteraceae bacterium]|nr:hypothetical protein [Candidatus Baltobacteraceae bacterium]